MYWNNINSYKPRDVLLKPDVFNTRNNGFKESGINCRKLKVILSQLFCELEFYYKQLLHSYTP